MFIAILNLKHDGVRYSKGDEVLADKKVLDVLLDKNFIVEVATEERTSEGTGEPAEEVQGNELPQPGKKKERKKRKLK